MREESALGINIPSSGEHWVRNFTYITLKNKGEEDSLLTCQLLKKMRQGGEELGVINQKAGSGIKGLFPPHRDTDQAGVSRR